MPTSSAEDGRVPQPKRKQLDEAQLSAQSKAGRKTGRIWSPSSGQRVPKGDREISRAQAGQGARKIEKPVHEASTPARTAHTLRQKCADWEYVGPDLTNAGVPQDELLTCSDGRAYPISVTCSEEDLLLEE